MDIFVFRYSILHKSLVEHEISLNDAKKDLERGKLIIYDSHEKLPKLAERFTFYQEMNDYIDDLVACFNEKVGLLYECFCNVLKIAKQLMIN